MTEVHHFAYGPLTPAAAYVMSFVGSLLGLLCTARARASAGASRANWLALAALAIGGTGIWVMHFIAMLGFSVAHTEIRYDVPLTLLSCLTAIAVVAVGLFLVGFGGSGAPVVIAAGLITGAGVASMHYTGMKAMNMSAQVSYRPALVALSVVIALVAATVALWFSVRVTGKAATAGAAAIMGIAVCGMHYTGMAAMRVEAHHGTGSPSGAGAIDFVLPLVVGVGVVATVLLLIIAMSPTEEDARADAALRERLTSRGRPQGAPDAGGTRAAVPEPPTRTAGEWFGGGPGH
ncbi:MHYT domain-containing protein [Actinomadura sp. B10D3]|uniref:MHYT domain-containing protein n=1 Tax=Actinomadura sp. B10D3 TaxID=3153557 RepID=UPI00325CA4D0